MVDPAGVLFVGVGGQPVCYYRCALPAQALGCGWVGVDAAFHVVQGNLPTELKSPDLSDYHTVVLQQPFGPNWLQRIRLLQEKGIRVFYETDDYLHGIKNVPEHPFYKWFVQTRVMREYDRCMAACDGTIVSTRFLAERYAKLSPSQIRVCPNGIDLDRYDLHRPPRDYTTVGWAGAGGHVGPLVEWLNGGVLDELEKRETSRFTCIGNPPIARAVAESIGSDRATGVPWSAIETYPAAVADADVMLAPAGKSTWARGKSDLRWLEASALGLPCVCNHWLYPEADLRATNAREAATLVAQLMDNPSEARELGAYAQTEVRRRRAFPEAAAPWAEALGL